MRPRRQPERVQEVEFGPNLPTFRGMQSAIATVVDGAGNPSQVQFDLWENGAEDVFAPVVTGSPAVLIAVQGLIPGVYSVLFACDFAPDLGPGVNAGVGIETNVGTFLSDPIAIHPSDPRPGFNTSGHYSVQLVRGYPPQWLHEGLTTPALAPQLPEFTFTVAQDSGTDRDTFTPWFEIFYLGGLSVDTSVLGTP